MSIDDEAKLTFHIDCYVCKSETTVLIESEDEEPGFCPMCGSEVVDIENIEP